MATAVEVALTSDHFRGLHRLQAHAGKRFVRGVLLYDGETCASFGNGMHVVPIRALWEKLPV